MHLLTVDWVWKRHNDRLLHTTQVWMLAFGSGTVLYLLRIRQITAFNLSVILGRDLASADCLNL